MGVRFLQVAMETLVVGCWVADELKSGQVLASRKACIPSPPERKSEIHAAPSSAVRAKGVGVLWSQPTRKINGRAGPLEYRGGRGRGVWTLDAVGQYFVMRTT